MAKPDIFQKEEKIEGFFIEGDKPPSYAPGRRDDKKTNAHKTSITDENIVRK